MPSIPENAARQHLVGLPLQRRGKVRDTYEGLTDSTCIFPVATDRISAFDFVLPTEIQGKGEVLTAMNVFWRTEPLASVIGPNHDLVAFGTGVDAFLPDELKNNSALQKRSLVVKKKPMCSFEGIPRGYLTGTGLEAYEKSNPHCVCGHLMPHGLYDGSELPRPIFTTTTKAEVGHDTHILFQDVQSRYGDKPGILGMAMYSAAQEYAKSRGLIIADTKFEFWKDDDGTVGIGDEVLTPDSSRFWLAPIWRKSQEKKQSPAGMDKEFVRKFLKGLNVDLLDPENPKHLKRVSAVALPENICRVTAQLYRYAFWKLVGSKLEKYQREKMGIAVRDRRLRIEIVIGSESDRPQLERGLAVLKGRADFRVTVLSCHRNDDLHETLDDFVKHELLKADIGILCAGEAAALPGIGKTKTCKYGRPELPIIGVACKGKNEEADLAAKLSIKRLPGQPVELDPHGEPYFAASGFEAACMDALEHEFLPKAIESKPSVTGTWMF